MKYLLMIYANETWEQTQTESWDDALVARYIQLAEHLQKQGVFLDGRRLAGTETATTVTVRDGQTLVSDGPFAETKEQLGGFFLVECRDLDHATEVAAQIPSAEYGSIEIRPLYYQE